MSSVPPTTIREIALEATHARIAEAIARLTRLDAVLDRLPPGLHMHLGLVLVDLLSRLETLVAGLEGVAGWGEVETRVPDARR